MKAIPPVTGPLGANEPSERTNVRRLGTARGAALIAMGVITLRDLLEFEPVKAALTLRALLSASSSSSSSPQLARLVDEKYASRDVAEVPTWPVTALRGVSDEQSRRLAGAGVRTIHDLLGLAAEAEEAILAASRDNGFQERPSAPAQLLPGILGSISSSVRFTTFIRDVELRKLTFPLHKDCLVSLPVTQKGSLAEIFEKLRCPVVHLGYMCDHRQQWINLGTHLGEVVHSVSLAPGESRNIAMVNWHRRQSTAREEQTRAREGLSATFVQNRALEEITSAVAREHQSGGTQTEANTAATAVGAVGAVAGSVALGSGIGALIGSVVPGIGTAVGAAGGGLAGAVSGVIAAGAVVSNAGVLGTIEADTEGSRTIVADVHQRIALSTSQNASAVRSLWSTVVVEDTQSEGIEATTSNITNYNHMHALNVQYYEVLQHYLAQIELQSVQPILYLPFTFLEFNDFRFIRDYWDVIRHHVDDEALRAQGDSYFVTEAEPAAPDLLNVPAQPLPDFAGLAGLRLQVMFVYDERIDMSLAVDFGDSEVEGTEEGTRTTGDVRFRTFSFGPMVHASKIRSVKLTVDRDAGGKVGFTIRLLEGTLANSSERQRLQPADIGKGTIKTGDRRESYSINWNLPNFDAPALAVEAALINRIIANAEAENARRLAAFEALVANLERFKERLQRLVLRRRHFFTRAILGAIEPEEITQLLEALQIGHVNAANPRLGIPLSEIAHTIPIGMTGGAFVLKLKRITPPKLKKLVQTLHLDIQPAHVEMATLLQYADLTKTFFEERAQNDPLTQVDHVYIPTGGLFAEAILGRANGAEYLDIERFFNWQDSPIPHQPPPIQPVGTESRFQQGEANVTVPQGTLQVINPVALPDPTGLQGVLGAIQNGNIFRDLSKSAELAGIIGNLTALAGQMGQAAASLTGQAAQQALAASTEISKVAAGLASQATSTAGAGFDTVTGQGAALNKAREIDAANASQAAPASPAPSAGSEGSAVAAPPPSTAGTNSEDIVRKAAGLAPRAAPRRNRTLNVRLVFESPHGVPISYDVLSDMPKTFRLFHENDVRDENIGGAQELINPFYVFPLENWTASNGELLVELDYGAGSFENTVSVDIPASATTMIVRARIAAREQTVERSRQSSRTQALTAAVEESLGVSATVGGKVANVVDVGIGITADSASTLTDEDSTSATTGTTVTETLKVPTGGLDITVQFKQ